MAPSLRVLLASKDAKNMVPGLVLKETHTSSLTHTFSFAIKKLTVELEVGGSNHNSATLYW